MSKVTISAIQMDVKHGDLKSNLEKAFKMIEKAANKGANFVVLPEMWPTGFDYETLQKLPASYVDEVLGLLGDLSARYSLYIISGSLCEPAEGQFFNTSIIIDPSGKPMGQYRKVHLFKDMGEQDFFTPGTEIPTFDTKFAKIGIAICYDIRFPELFSALSTAGAQMIFVPAEFPRPRIEHWQTLLRARAIENQLFVIGCNRVGKAGTREYFGHSTLIGPYGEIIDELEEDEDILTESIELDKIREIRENLPSFNERRPEVYGAKKQGGLKFKDSIQPMKPRH